MKALVYTKYGPPDVLQLKEVEKPLPGEDEVLVRVHATTVNRTDWATIRAKPVFMRIVTGLFKPKKQIPGTAFAGEVEAVGWLLTCRLSGKEDVMKVLFYGAGVMGSLYAARLQDAGCEVSILARGQLLKDLREYGVVLQHVLTGEQTITRVDVVEQLSPEDAYDLIIVAMRKNQVPAVLPIWVAHQRTQNVMFMVNNPSGYDDWQEAVGRERLLLEFPGAVRCNDSPLNFKHWLGKHRWPPPRSISLRPISICFSPTALSLN